MSARVSVLVPVFNGERYLEEAVRSVLAQTDRDIEVLVLDDGSSDRSGDIARSLPVRYVRLPHAGLPATLNRGLALAQGELVSFLDADDLYEPQKIARQAAFLDAHPAADMVLCRLRNVGEPGGPLPAQAFMQEGERLLLQMGALLARRPVFARVGPFTEAHTAGSDVDWFLRAKEAGVRLAILPETLLRRRVHGGALSQDAAANRRGYLQAVKSALARRRKAEP